MSDFNEQSFQRRSLLLLVLVGIFVISVMCVTLSLLVLRKQTEEEYLGQRNVLFIIVDDLRPVLGCYGDKIAVTPNIDQLASKGVLFKNAFAQEALGAPSRTSFLTSRRPDSLHLYDSGSYWRDAVKSFVTLPQHFKFHGYETISVGKVFPYGTASNMTDDYPYSWTRYPYHPSIQANGNQHVCPSNNEDFLICPVNVDSQVDGSLPDVETTDHAISYLKNKTKVSDQDAPFFLSVGYYRPHIPFQIPKEYLDLYPIDSMELAPNQNITPMLLNIAWNPWTDIREKDDIKALNISFPYGSLPDDMQLHIRQAYYASVSYIDDQIGKLLQALEDAGYAEHTSVVLLGDNGWSLGEHQEWSKYSNFEVSLRVPLIFYTPELMEDKKSRNPFQHHEVLKHAPNSEISTKPTAPSKEMYTPRYVTGELVELVDLFPTLTEVVDLPVPPLCRVYSTLFCSEGISFYSLMEQLVTNPLPDFSWKTAAFSQFPRPSMIPQNNSDQPALEDIKFMGYSIRTNRFRYTEWVGFNNTHFKPNWTNIMHAELYDHEFDPFEIDNKLKGYLKHDYLNVASELSKRIKKGWRHAMPHGFFDSPRKFNEAELL